MATNSDTFTLNLVGGLGNQLHGMAAGYAIAGRTGLKPIFDGTDIPWGSNASRKIEVNKFNWPDVSGVNAPIKIMRPLVTPFRNGPHQRVMARIRDSVKRNSDLVSLDKYEELNQIMDFAHEGKTLSGYFAQSEWIFDAFKFGFPTQLTPKRDSKPQPEQPYNALHIRLGDYLWHRDVYPLVTERYLLSGIEKMDSNLPLYIFTDDLVMTNANYPQIVKKASKIIGPKDASTIASFIGLSFAKNIITANSSFSSWAGIFVEQNGGKVIAPNLMNHSDSKDFRPKNWIRIDINTGNLVS